MTARGGIYDGRHGDGKPVETVRDSCGCVFCDLNLPVFEGQHIKEDYHRALNGDRVPCTRNPS